MHFGYIANLARPDNLASGPMPLVRVALVSHLSGNFVLEGRFGQQAGFPRSPRQWFLNVDVLAAFHAPESHSGVHVVGRGDDHGVDVFAFLVQHLAEVDIVRRFLKPLESGSALPRIHVA